MIMTILEFEFEFKLEMSDFGSPVKNGIYEKLTAHKQASIWKDTQATLATIYCIFKGMRLWVFSQVYTYPLIGEWIMDIKK